MSIELISSLDLNWHEIGQHFDMKRVIGTSDVVSTRPEDEILYAVRRNCDRDGLVPFTKTGKPEQCSALSIT